MVLVVLKALEEERLRRKFSFVSRVERHGQEHSLVIIGAELGPTFLNILFSKKGCKKTAVTVNMANVLWSLKTLMQREAEVVLGMVGKRKRN